MKEEEDYFGTKLGDNFKIEGFNIYAKSTNMWKLGNWEYFYPNNPEGSLGFSKLKDDITIKCEYGRTVSEKDVLILLNHLYKFHNGYRNLQLFLEHKDKFKIFYDQFDLNENTIAYKCFIEYEYIHESSIRCPDEGNRVCYYHGKGYGRGRDKKSAFDDAISDMTQCLGTKVLKKKDLLKLQKQLKDKENETN